MKYIVLFSILVVFIFSCNKKENPSPAVSSVSQYEATYQGDLYRSNLDGSGAFLYQSGNSVYVYKDIFNNYWFSRAMGIDSVSMTITGNSFVLHPILKPDQACLTGNYFTYMYEGNGTFSGSVINFDFKVRSTDLCNRDEKRYYGSFTKL